jgi:hypothetical protein
MKCRCGEDIGTFYKGACLNCVAMAADRLPIVERALRLACNTVLAQGIPCDGFMTDDCPFPNSTGQEAEDDCKKCWYEYFLKEAAQTSEDGRGGA